MKPAPRRFTRLRTIDGDEHRTEVTIHASGYVATKNYVAGKLVSRHGARRNGSDVPLIVSLMACEGFRERTDPYSVGDSGIEDAEAAVFLNGEAKIYGPRGECEAAARELNRGAA